MSKVMEQFAQRGPAKLKGTPMEEHMQNVPSMEEILAAWKLRQNENQTQTED